MKTAAIRFNPFGRKLEKPSQCFAHSFILHWVASNARASHGLWETLSSFALLIYSFCARSYVSSETHTESKRKRERTIKTKVNRLLQSHNYSCIKIKSKKNSSQLKKGASVRFCFRCIFSWMVSVYIVCVRVLYKIYHLRECNVPSKATFVSMFSDEVFLFCLLSLSHAHLQWSTAQTYTNQRPQVCGVDLPVQAILNFQRRYFNSFHTVHNNQLHQIV